MKIGQRDARAALWVAARVSDAKQSVEMKTTNESKAAVERRRAPKKFERVEPKRSAAGPERAAAVRLSIFAYGEFDPGSE